MNKLNVIYKVIKWILNRPPDLNIGELWYIKLSNTSPAETVQIDDITEKTVLLSQNITIGQTRYKITDIDFIEKVKTD